MCDMASNDEYEIAIIENETDARLCAKLIAEEFALYNPLSVFNHSTAEKLYNSWFWPLMNDVLDETLSFLVRHRPTNEIVAAIIASDLFLFREKHPYDAAGPASNDPMVDLFDEMDDRFVHHDFHEELKPNMVLCISDGATQAKHSGKGVATQLRAHVCDHARDTKGFQYASIQTAHAATRHIYVKKMNGKEMTILDPATWLWKKKGDGLSRPVKDYKGEPIVNILVKLK
jgi:GNAT superfamily N-acetyltransferase